MNWLTRLSLAAMLVLGLSIDADAARLYLPLRCTDDNGDVVSGCRAYTFEAGTTTIYQTFSDAALTTNHGDYVTADSSGEFPDTYVANTQCLKVEFRESDGTTVIDTLDDECPTLSTSEITTSLLTGTAATASIGTSGDVLGKLNTANTYSALQTFNSDIEVNSTSAAATAAPTVTLSRDSTTPAANDDIGEIVFQGKDDGTGDVNYGSVYASITDPADTEEDGAVCVEAIVAGTETEIACAGVFDSTDTTLIGINLASGYSYFVDSFYAPGTPLAVLQDQKTSGTDGGTCTSGSWQTRDLNTEVFDTYTLSSISSNQFTLQPGTYLIHWSAPAHRVNSHQTRLYDVTNTAAVESGSTEESDRVTDSESEGMHVMTRSEGWARISISSATVYRIEHQCETTDSTTGFGTAGSFGTEVYTIVTVWAA